MPKITIVLEVDSDFDIMDVTGTNRQIADIIADEITSVLRDADISATVTPTHVDGESLGNS